MKNCLLGTLILCFSASSTFAQAPGWSRGQQTLAISYDECMGRAPAALAAEGYRRDDEPGGNAAVGIKGVHTAVIICGPAPDARMLVNIVVASNGDGGGAERQRLQAQMDRAGSGQRPSSCTAPDFLNTAFEWIDNGRSLGVINFFREGTARQTWLTGASVTWRTDANGDLLINTNGTTWVTRLKYDPTTCAFRGTRDGTSQTQDGVQSVLTARR